MTIRVNVDPSAQSILSSTEVLTTQASALNTAAYLGFVPGAIGGFCNVLVGHPLDLVKVRQQCRPVAVASLPATTLGVVPSSFSTTFHMMRSILLSDGPVGLYAGVSAPILAVVPAFGIMFWSFEAAQSWQLQRSSQSELSVAQTAVAGGFSGIPLALVLGPLEKIKCEFQVQSTQSKSFINAVQQSMQQGLLFRGTGLTIARDVPGNAAYFAGYEVVRRRLCELEGRTHPSMAATLIAGGMAGVCNWVVAIPIDVVKSRWQTCTPGSFTSPWHVTTNLMQTEGLWGFFRGLSPALLRAFPANAACLLGVETARRWIGES